MAKSAPAIRHIAPVPTAAYPSTLFTYLFVKPATFKYVVTRVTFINRDVFNDRMTITTCLISIDTNIWDLDYDSTLSAIQSNSR